jgi:hypothetical protein
MDRPRSLPRVLVLALYLLQGGMLLPLHHHAEHSAGGGPRLDSGCHQGLPCSDPGHRHPDPLSGHPRACVACAAALRPIVVLGQVPLPTPSPTRCAAEHSRQSPVPRPASRSASERAPPADLSA